MKFSSYLPPTKRSKSIPETEHRMSQELKPYVTIFILRMHDDKVTMWCGRKQHVIRKLYTQLDESKVDFIKNNTTIAEIRSVDLRQGRCLLQQPQHGAAGCDDRCKVVVVKTKS